jgi:hypothetical protein
MTPDSAWDEVESNPYEVLEDARLARIRRLAYALYQARSGTYNDGGALADWLAAENAVEIEEDRS